MSNIQEDYIGTKFIVGQLGEGGEIVKVDKVWQDDGGPEDFYLVTLSESDGRIGEFHIQDYEDGLVLEEGYNSSDIIWIDEDNTIDRDYFELAHGIDINNMDENEKEFYDRIIALHKEVVNV